MKDRTAYRLYPESEPFRTGFLPVSDLHTLYYEEVGNPQGVPAVFLHGGPGVGIMPKYRQFFDPKVYHLVLFDQRGAGKSTPHAELRENTTWNLVEDIEMLRQHLGLERWVVFGGSWGSMLALCYAIRHPQSVKGIIIRGVCLGRKFETDWLHSYGASEIYPDEWERYQSLIPPAERDNMVKAYYERLTGDDPEMQLKAATAFTRWEGATMSIVMDQDSLEEFLDPHTCLSIGRIECTYTLKDWFLPSDNYILDHARILRDIPCRIVQGRYDVICPVRSAWDLHQALPQSKLVIVPLGAHSPVDDGMASELVRATEDFKYLK